MHAHMRFRRPCQALLGFMLPALGFATVALAVSYRRRPSFSIPPYLG